MRDGGVHDTRLSPNALGAAAPERVHGTRSRKDMTAGPRSARNKVFLSRFQPYDSVDDERVTALDDEHPLVEWVNVLRRRGVAIYLPYGHLSTVRAVEDVPGDARRVLRRRRNSVGISPHEARKIAHRWRDSLPPKVRVQKIADVSEQTAAGSA
jgi:hypothetical protein